MYIAGVRIDQKSRSEVLETIQNALVKKQQTFVFTPNPEMIVKASREPDFKTVLNQGTTNICDGFGLFLVATLFGKKIERIPGTDLLYQVLEICAKENCKVFLAGSLGGTYLAAAEQNLLSRYPNLRIVGKNVGPKISEAANGSLAVDPSENEKLLTEIKASEADVVVVAFGMGKQEKWIVKMAPELPGQTLFLGVGGALDYASGLVPRAPRLLRFFGLEWLYRLVRQPHRFRRIATAVFVFPLVAFIDTWKHLKDLGR